jgi:hypothetical protein
VTIVTVPTLAALSAKLKPAEPEPITKKSLFIALRYIFCAKIAIYGETVTDI